MGDAMTGCAARSRFIPTVTVVAVDGDLATEFLMTEDRGS
jgi:hypothetical protein